MWLKPCKFNSLRSEITLFEAARAYAAADGRQEVVASDLYEIAPMALRARRSNFMIEYFNTHQAEEQEIVHVIDRILK